MFKVLKTTTETLYMYTINHAFKSLLIAVQILISIYIVFRPSNKVSNLQQNVSFNKKKLKHYSIKPSNYNIWMGRTQHKPMCDVPRVTQITKIPR